MRPFFAALLAPTLLPCALSAQPDPVTVLERAERVYAGITTIRAEFSQVLENPMLGAPEPSNGVMFLKPPNKFSMRFKDPEGDRIVADGTWLWTYAPSSVPNQVIRSEIPAHGATTPNLMAEFVERPLERYTAAYVGADTVVGETVDVIRLTPKVEGLPFREAVIAVARSDGLLRRIAIREESGQRRTIVFERIQVNVLVPESELAFEVPNGVRVVRQ